MTHPHWVLIESGSTQEFIFQSNRQRFHVGASALVTDLKTWVREAAARTPAVTVVSAISGSAVLLADDPDAGRALVGRVTERALREAPGLDVWGYVEPHAADDPMPRLAAAREALNRARVCRPGAKARFPISPFFDVCVATGLPAVTTRTALGQRDQTVSALTEAVWDRAQTAHAMWRTKLGDAVVTDPDEELAPQGWTAIIHIDGNGVGAAIDRLKGPDDYTTFSEGLETATAEALTTAVGKVEATHWLLPILVGGDDVTLICRASAAVTFTREYLRAFEAETTSRVPGGGLTASAGIAFVKPHYPFSEAHELAQQLTRSAKQGSKEAPGRSAWDFHVLHDSLSRPLDEIRVHHAVTAPLLIGDDATILQAVAELLADQPPISNKARHALREALLKPRAIRKSALDSVRARVAAVGGETAGRFIDQHLGEAGASLLTVMDLVDVTTGTSKAVN